MEDLQELEGIIDEHFGRSTGVSVEREQMEVEEESTDEVDWGEDDDEEQEEDMCNRREERLRRVIQQGQDMCGPGGDAGSVARAECTGNDAENIDPNSQGEFHCQCPAHCFDQLDSEEIQYHRLSLREMTKDEKEMHIMGVLLPFTSKKTWRGERQRKRYSYTYNGKKICRSSFLHVFDIGQRTLKSLIKHMDIHGKVPRIHGNKNRRPHNALTFDQVRHCVEYLSRYGEEYGLPQPAAPRGRDDEAPVYLPASMNKCGIHAEYCLVCTREQVKPLGLSSFKATWNQCLPHLRIATPRDDVCHKCELIKKRVQDAVTEDEKLQAANESTEHVAHARSERQFYKETLETAKQDTPKDRPNGPIPPCTLDLQTIHFTFDYCQQISVPHHFRQMGPLYFMTPRKVQIFGVRDDGSPRQYNYLIDEDQSVGVDGTSTHGPNAVISMLDHALTFYGHGEKGCVLHCDNCPGQNKNRFTLAYLSWRTVVGLHDNISIHMQVPGHTRCLVDTGFAHLKKLFRRSDVDALPEFVTLVNKSSITNTAVPFMKDDGESMWTWNDWKTFLLELYKPFPGISKYHHFYFKKDEPGFVYAKTKIDDPCVKKYIIKKNVVIDPFVGPRIIAPGGLSQERQKYLYKIVRPFVRPEWQDVTCPRVDGQ